MDYLYYISHSYDDYKKSYCMNKDQILRHLEWTREKQFASMKEMNEELDDIKKLKDYVERKDVKIETLSIREYVPVIRAIPGINGLASNKKDVLSEIDSTKKAVVSGIEQLIDRKMSELNSKFETDFSARRNTPITV